MYYNNRRLALSVFWVLLGAVLLVLTLTERLDSAIYSGMGGAMMGVGGLQIYRNLKYRRNPEYREKIATEGRDERLKYLRMKSWSWTGYIVCMLQAVGVVVAMILGQRNIQIVLGFSVCLMLVLFWVFYLFLSRKY